MLTAGAEGKRYVLPNARVMIHQPLIGGGGISGQATDIEIHAREMLKTKKKLIDIYVKHTGREYDFLHDSMERDNFMGAEEAKDFGLVDTVVESRKRKQSQA